MPLTQQECAAAIADHSRGFAEAAAGNLDAEVEFCPGWTVRDVVHHLTRVQWFWATLVEDRHAERPDDLEEPEPAADETALAVFRSGAERLVRVLGEADPAIRVWTWAPSQQTAAFVIRHQVQEAVGHHWDVAHAAGGTVRIDPAVGADAVDEFLQVSVSNADDAADAAAGKDALPAPLEGRLGLACVDSDAAWLRGRRLGAGYGDGDTDHEGRSRRRRGPDRDRYRRTAAAVALRAPRRSGGRCRRRRARPRSARTVPGAVLHRLSTTGSASWTHNARRSDPSSTPRPTATTRSGWTSSSRSPTGWSPSSTRNPGSAPSTSAAGEAPPCSRSPGRSARPARPSAATCRR